MLVLKRKVGESLTLTTEHGEVIRIKYVRHQGGGIRLGIDASKSVAVLRSELEQIERVVNAGSVSGANGITVNE